MCAAQANVTARLRTVAGIQEHIGTIVRDGTIAAKCGEFICGMYGVDSNDTTLTWDVGVYPAWLPDAQDSMELRV
jgi:hypothetical protein